LRLSFRASILRIKKRLDGARLSTDFRRLTRIYIKFFI
jgi:hypothetical protein